MERLLALLLLGAVRDANAAREGAVEMPSELEGQLAQHEFSQRVRVEALEAQIRSLSSRAAALESRIERATVSSNMDSTAARRMSSSSSPSKTGRLAFDGAGFQISDSVNITGTIAAEVCRCGELVVPPTPVAFADFAVDTVDLTLTATDLNCFKVGFYAGAYVYYVPYGSTGSKIARVLISDFSTVSFLDLSLTDTDLSQFEAGFADDAGTYGYFLPASIGSYKSGKVARVTLSDFSTVDIIDMTTTDADLVSFGGGFTDGTDYGYVNTCYSATYGYIGKIARFSLSDPTSRDVLDLQRKINVA